MFCLKKIRTRILLCLAVLSILPYAMGTGCPPTDPAAGLNLDPANGRFNLFTNPDDPRLLQFDGDDGETITIFGDRDENGQPTRITSLFLQEPSEVDSGQGTWVDFDDEDRVTRVVGIDGSVLNLDWQNDLSAVLGAISGDGAAQVNTMIEIDEATAERPRWADDETTRSSSVEKGFTREQPAGGDNTTLVLVNLRRCGEEPEAGDVTSVVVTIESTSPPTTIPATRLDSGRYAARVKFSSASQPNDAEVKALCNSFANIALRSCRDEGYAQRVQSQLCGKLAAALDAAGLGGGDPANSLQKSCMQGFKTLKSYCTLMEGAVKIGGALGQSPTESVSGVVCDQLKGVIDELASGGGGPVLVSATATVRGSGTRKSPGTVDISAADVLGGPPPQLTVDFGNTAQLLSAETIPPDPGPAQGYTFRLQVSCANGMRFNISVVGSDGFTKSETFTSVVADDTFDFSVPGAAANVRDTITVTDEGTGATLRTVSIVF